MYFNMELTYTKHISNIGATYTIASVADVFPMTLLKNI